MFALNNEVVDLNRSTGNFMCAMRVSKLKQRFSEKRIGVQLTMEF